MRASFGCLLMTFRPPAENTAVTACLSPKSQPAGRTDPSKLNSALAGNPTEVERAACFDEVNINLGEL